MKLRDMQNKRSEIEEVVNHMKKAFKSMKRIKKIDCVLVNDWLFDQLEYPDKIADYIKEIKARMPESSNTSTITSNK